MVGQERAKAEVGRLALNALPKALLIWGPKGIGKSTFIDKVVKPHFNMDSVDITRNINYEIINELYNNVVERLYIIDLDTITDRAQNSLLKFIEEPPSHAFIVLKIENITHALKTIVDRSYVIGLEPYTAEELETFIGDLPKESQEIARQVGTTPGKIMGVKGQDVNEIRELCEKIVTKMNQASLPNTLTIIDKIGFTETHKKYNLDLFIELLKLELNNCYINTNSKGAYRMLEETIKAEDKFSHPTANKKMLFENFLIKLWKAAR